MAANKAVMKALKILELISKNPEGITLSEICKELNLPKATAYDILRSLYQEDAVYFKNEQIKNYVIGSQIFTIGQSYIKNSNFITFASPFLKDFAKRYSVSTLAQKRIGTKMACVYKYEAPEAKLTTEDIGSQAPLSTSIAGLTFLTFVTDEKKTELYDRTLSEGSTFSNEAVKILANVNANRKNGYLFDNGTFHQFVCELAVPVYNFEGKMSGVLSTVRLPFDENDETKETFIKDFLNIASTVSQMQGYRAEK